jgi:hypothetical protein
VGGLPLPLAEAALVGHFASSFKFQAVSPGQDQIMKINLTRITIVALFFLCFVCATAGAQTAAVLPNTPAPMQMTDHPQHASEHTMARESSLLSVSAYGYAQGEVPLAELGSIPYQTPLGDIARANRKEHVAVPKAVMTLEKQQ